MNIDVNEIIQAFLNVILPVLVTIKEPVPCRTSLLSGHLYFHEIMSTPNENRFIEVCRMRKETFDLLLHKLQN